MSSLTNAVGQNIFQYPPWDVSISGPGYLVVRDPAYGVLGVTRFGALNIDSDGYLVTGLGERVQGYIDPALIVFGDVQINNAGSLLTMTSYQIQSNGCIMVTLSDGSSFVRCQILLQNFQNPSALIAQGELCFGWSDAAGPLSQPVPPGTSGTGWLVPGTLEQLIPTLQLSRYQGPPKTFAQGVVVYTGVTADVGIEGNGFFVLRRTNDNVPFATRAGAFYVDGSGYLVHYSGLRLQGYSDSTLTSIGDLQISPDVYVSDYDIDQHGVVTEYLIDGTSVVRGQILLAGCSNPDLVTRTNFDLYALVTNTGLWSSPAAPMTGNLGWVVPGALEVSQFDTNLLTVRSNLNFFSQGIVVGNNTPSSLAIEDTGFFVIRDPVANTVSATRWGDFQLDLAGYLETKKGCRVQGFTNSLATQIGDISIEPACTGFQIDNDGNVEATLPDGSQFFCGQVLVQEYGNLQGLIPMGDGYYSNLAAAEPMITNGTLAGQRYLLLPNALEEPAPSPPPLQLPPPAGGFRLFISNLNSGTVQSSTDLVHWNAIGTVEGSDLSVAEFYDKPQTIQTFYRVVGQDF